MLPCIADFSYLIPEKVCRYHLPDVLITTMLIAGQTSPLIDTFLYQLPEKKVHPLIDLFRLAESAIRGTTVNNILRMICSCFLECAPLVNHEFTRKITTIAVLLKFCPKTKLYFICLIFL